MVSRWREPNGQLTAKNLLKELNSGLSVKS
jgi:hypothetical protein